MITSLITIGSQTSAMKAQKILNSYGISSETVKIDGRSSRGCIYGLRVASDDLITSNRLLYNMGLVKEK